MSNFCYGKLRLTPDWRLEGWCWYEDQPIERATVDILVNGRPVRAIRAVQPRPELLALGMGDGNCGFLVSLGGDYLSSDHRVMVEATERRFGKIFGRIFVGKGKSDFEERLEMIAHRFDEAIPRLGYDHSGEARLAECLKEIGRGLTKVGYGGVAVRHGDLRDLLERLAAVPPTNLSFSLHPKVSVVVQSTLALYKLAKGLRQVSEPLASQAELILIAKPSEPLGLLLPARLRHLRVAWSDGLSLGAGYNAAAMIAKGEWIAFVSDIQRTNAACLLEVVAKSSLDTTYIGSDVFNKVGKQWQAVSKIEEKRFSMGLHCLVPRDIFFEAGGVCGSAETSHAMVWPDFVSRLSANRSNVVVWQEPQKFYTDRDVEEW